MDSTNEVVNGGARKTKRTKGIKKAGCGCNSNAATVGGKSSKRDCVKKPKRKPSAYNLFIKSAYARLKKAHPNHTAPQIMKLAAAEWRAKK